MSACKIKFCGLRTVEDIRVACECRVWAVGLVFTTSPRQVDIATGKRLAAEVDAGILKVGLFTDEPADEVRRIAETCRLDLVQIHRNITDKEAAEYGDLPLLRVFRIAQGEDLAPITESKARRFILDTYVSGTAGGTGRSFDWNLARKAGEYGEVILAGGLTPENVAQAIGIAAPWGVDVSGGIEKEKGIKDHGRMREFARAVGKLANSS